MLLETNDLQMLYIAIGIVIAHTWFTNTNIIAYLYSLYVFQDKSVGQYQT